MSSFTLYDYQQYVHKAKYFHINTGSLKPHRLPLIIYNSIQQIHLHNHWSKQVHQWVFRMYPSLPSAIQSGVSLGTKQTDRLFFLYSSKNRSYFTLPPHAPGVLLALHLRLFSICITDTLNMLLPILSVYVMMEASTWYLMPLGQYWNVKRCWETKKRLAQQTGQPWRLP